METRLTKVRRTWSLELKELYSLTQRNDLDLTEQLCDAPGPPRPTSEPDLAKSPVDEWTPIPRAMLQKLAESILTNFTRGNNKSGLHKHLR